jgi:hypothetical protein
MPSKFRPKLSYANVVATVCLFVVLGGSSLAAPVRDGAKRLITGKQVKDSSLTTKDIKNASLLSKDFKAGQLLAGPKGSTGPKGDRGQDGSPDTGDDILTKLSGVDGAGSGLDADTIDGITSRGFARLGGVINGDGTVLQGTGFTVTHPSVGVYQVSFPAGALTDGLCPPVVTTVAFAGLVRIPQVTARGCSGGGAGNFTVTTLDTSAVARDTPFVFIAM